MDKLRIVGLEGGSSNIVIEAQFNPKEVSLDKSVPWQKQKKQGATDLEFTTGEPKTLALELMFDSFESGTPIQHAIDKIHTLSDVDAGLKHPPKVKVVWGEGAAGMIPKFEGVIESVAVTPRARSAGQCRPARFLQTPFRSRRK